MTKRTVAPALSGHVVAITGGARGIGRSCAQAFAKAGASVAIGDLDLDLARAAAGEIATETGGSVIALQLDVTDRASFGRFFDDLEAQLGPADVLVNNAGIMPTGRLVDEDDAMTDRMIDINLRGVITGSRIAARRFVARGSGTIVNVASLAGVSPFAGLATYCATKHAVVGFSQSIARELEPEGVHVSTVLPGVVRTELSAGVEGKKWLEPLSVVDPEQVADAMVRAVLSQERRVTVPSVLGAMLFVMSLLPRRVREWTERLTGTDRGAIDADPASRAAYHHRIQDGIK